MRLVTIFCINYIKKYTAQYSTVEQSGRCSGSSWREELELLDQRGGRVGSDSSGRGELSFAFHISITFGWRGADISYFPTEILFL